MHQLEMFPSVYLGDLDLDTVVSILNSKGEKCAL